MQLRVVRNRCAAGINSGIAWPVRTRNWPGATVSRLAIGQAGRERDNGGDDFVVLKRIWSAGVMPGSRELDTLAYPVAKSPSTVKRCSSGKSSRDRN